MKKIFTILVILISIGIMHEIHAQTPNNQDCMGAIPVCQYTYSQSNSYSGTGNYPNEISTVSGCPGNCMGAGEKNDVWYIFTVQTGGNLSFTITPNSSGDDYDWAVYNLTNANCSDIYTNSGLQVSCNFSATSGATGANGLGSSNCEDAGGGNDNAVIPVSAGQTYVLNVSNFSSTQYGYTLNFGASTASIFDNVPPVFQSVQTPIACGATSISFNFSENVLCNTVSAADFNLNGPGGPYTITGISGAGCTSGGTMENTYTITVTPAITTSGNYQICLNNSAGSVSDNCGNLAAPACFDFAVTSITTNFININAANCGPNGSATITASGGSGTYTYTWSTVPVQNTATASGLAGGTYYVTVSDGSCTAIDTLQLQDIGGPALTTSYTDEHCNNADGTATVTATGGSGVYTYTWSTVPVQNTASASGLSAGLYSVTVSDGGPCPSVASVTINNIGGPNLSLASSLPEDYGMCNGTATVNVTGGANPVTTTWNSVPPQNGTTASNLCSGYYLVTSTDANGCQDTMTVYIGITGGATLSVSTTPAHCGHDDGTATVTVTGPVGAYTITWLTTPPQNTATITDLVPGAYTVSVTDSLGTYTMVAIVNNAPGPNAAFMATPNPSTLGQDIVFFLDQSIGATNWLWDFGDGDGDMQQNTSHTYGAVGEYMAWLYVSNSYGCTDSTYQLIIVNDIFTFFIPSAFSPNGDGVNDVFMPYGISVDIDSYSMKIYDRWGILVFQTTSYNNAWDGTVRGVDKRDKVSDSYTYFIELKDYTGIVHDYRGKVILIH